MPPTSPGSMLPPTRLPGSMDMDSGGRGVSRQLDGEQPNFRMARGQVSILHRDSEIFGGGADGPLGICIVSGACLSAWTPECPINGLLTPTYFAEQQGFIAVRTSSDSIESNANPESDGYFVTRLGQSLRDLRQFLRSWSWNPVFRFD